jgi:hypothetical protein
MEKIKWILEQDEKILPVGECHLGNGFSMGMVVNPVADRCEQPIQYPSMHPATS